MDVVMEDVSLSNGRIEEDMELDEVVETEIFTKTDSEIRIKINLTKRSITIYL